MLRIRCFVTYLTLGCVLAALAFQAGVAKAEPRAAQAQQNITIPVSVRMEPAELAGLIHSGQAPVILQVGFTKLYEEAHIQGAIHAGPMVSPEGRESLRKTVAGMDRHAPLVIYCGCCPWVKCPNIRRAYEALRKMGFTNVKAVYIPDNFGADWVQHGYPTVMGK